MCMYRIDTVVCLIALAEKRAHSFSSLFLHHLAFSLPRWLWMVACSSMFLLSVDLPEGSLSPYMHIYVRLLLYSLSIYVRFETMSRVSLHEV